jgi:hypothetical protein
LGGTLKASLGDPAYQAEQHAFFLAKLRLIQVSQTRAAAKKFGGGGKLAAQTRRYKVPAAEPSVPSIPRSSLPGQKIQRTP